MDLGDFGRNFKRGAGSSSSPQGSPFKKQVVDPGAVQVEIKCDRYAVSARWQFGADRLKNDLLRVRVNSKMVERVDVERCQQILHERGEELCPVSNETYLPESRIPERGVQSMRGK